MTLPPAVQKVLNDARRFGINKGVMWPLTSTMGPAGQIFGVDLRTLATASTSFDAFDAQLIATAGGAWTWVERVQTAAGVWADGPRSGTLNAYQATPSAGTAPTPAVNDMVEMRESPDVDDVFEFLDYGGTFSLTVRNADLSAGQTGVATFNLDQTQGLRILSTGAATATATVQDCSDSLTGVVHAYLGAMASTNNQYLGRGNKSVKDGALYVDNAAGAPGWGTGNFPIYAAGALPNATTALIASAEYSTSTDGFGTSGHIHLLRAGSDQSNRVLYSTRCNVVYNRSPAVGVGTTQINYLLLDVEGAASLQPCFAAGWLGQVYYGGWFTAAGILFAGGLAIRPTTPVAPVTPPPPPPPSGKSMIRVLVRDGKGNPVAGRNVTQAATPGGSANTDANGYVDFTALNVGAAQAVTVTLAGTEVAFGYANWSGAGAATTTTNAINVDTVADLTTTVSFTLTPNLLTAFSLDPIAGTGTVIVDGVALNSTFSPTVSTALIANTTLADADGFYRANTSVGALTIKLPASPTPGRRITLKDSAGAAATNTLTFDGNGHNIDGTATITLTVNWQSVSVFYDGTTWLLY